jgi:hypothetical protein
MVAFFLPGGIMRKHPPRRTEIFVVRLWVEYLQQTPLAWRGEMEHVGGREVMHFRNLEELNDWIRRCVTSQSQSHEQEKE